jgi:hypothetical protein
MSLFALLLTVASAFATAQAPDKIIYEEKVRALFANPLEDYYEAGRKRPLFMISPKILSTGNWRGYIATWEIIDGSLYLQHVESWIGGRKATLQRLFGKRVRNGRIKATRFSGELRIPDGKELQYVHMGYGSVYERDIILTVEMGRITNKTIIDNTQRLLPSELELQWQELEKMKKPDKPPNREGESLIGPNTIRPDRSDEFHALQRFVMEVDPWKERLDLIELAVER